MMLYLQRHLSRIIIMMTGGAALFFLGRIHPAIDTFLPQPPLRRPGESALTLLQGAVIGWSCKKDTARN